MTRADDLRQQAATIEAEARRLRLRAERMAKRGLVFSASDLSERAVAHDRAAAQLRLSALNQETDA